MKYYYSQYQSPVGNLILIAANKYLYAVAFASELPKLKIKFPELEKKSNSIINLTVRQLDLYFAGKLKKFELPIKLSGSEFQIKAWNALKSIPYGQTISYKKQSQIIKKPKAFRAVGSANGKNPLCIVLPCHRVIASDGTLGGYTGGLKIKQKLLSLEKPGN